MFVMNFLFQVSLIEISMVAPHTHVMRTSWPFHLSKLCVRNCPFENGKKVFLLDFKGRQSYCTTWTDQVILLVVKPWLDSDCRTQCRCTLAVDSYLPKTFVLPIVITPLSIGGYTGPDTIILSWQGPKSEGKLLKPFLTTAAFQW